MSLKFRVLKALLTLLIGIMSILLMFLFGLLFTQYKIPVTWETVTLFIFSNLSIWGITIPLWAFVDYIGNK